MENEEMMTLLVNHAAELDKQTQRLRAKYVFSDEPLLEKFEADAKEWNQWSKIGVQ